MIYDLVLDLGYLELGCAASAAACAISKFYYPFILYKVCKSDVPGAQMYWLLLVAAPSAAPLVVCSIGVCFGSSGCFEPSSRWPHPQMREALIATTFN